MHPSKLPILIEQVLYHAEFWYLIAASYTRRVDLILLDQQIRILPADAKHWYYGDLLTVKGEPQSYIIDSDEAPGLVTARDPESGEEFVIFDGGRHGYDNMFCDEHDPSELEHRPLKRYEIPASKLVLELGYSIDYEDEKENFEPDEADTVELINGERMPWEQAKRDGIDYIALYYVNEKGKPVQILDAELA